MQYTKWNKIVKNLYETYGVTSGIGENEMAVAESNEDLNEAWVICPECGEPLYYIDFGDEIEDGCPICEYEWE